MSRMPWLVNLLWWGSALGEAKRFASAVNRVEETQWRVLQRILRANASTRYGRQYDFSSIDSVAAYQARVPLVRYEELKPYIEEMAAGVPDVLIPGRPLCFEPTSGSASASKLIPYTPSLRAEFQAGIAPWVADMFRHFPRLLAGRAYWSISPATLAARRTAGGIPIGFDKDTAYLNPMLQHLLDHTLAVPAAVAGIADMAAFRYVTLAFLLRARDLALISVWNPTFLTLLMAPLAEWAPQLADDLERGILTPPAALEPALQASLLAQLGSHPLRAQEVRAAFRESTDAPALFARLWPRLTLISCWTQAAARGPAAELRRLFPYIALAPKGLVATEGMVSFPLVGQAGAALALWSHFFEFLPEDAGAPALAAWQLSEGSRYRVVLSTGGGLYRYQLDDLVRVTGFVGECPCLDFIGKAGKVSDLYGEKLHEAHVAAVLERVFTQLESAPAFVLVAPDGEGVTDHYTLFLAGDGCPSPAILDSIRQACEDGLSENVHYAYCRSLGQLQALDVCWLGKAEPVFARYLAACQARGQRAGDIKATALDATTGWRQVLI